MPDDPGKTALADGREVSKGDARLVAVAHCEDATASVGIALAHGASLADESILLLGGVLNDLLDVADDLSTPVGGRTAREPVRIDEGYLARADRLRTHYEEQLPPVSQRVVPGGGSATGALVHKARSAVLVAERAAWAAYDAHGATMNVRAPEYLGAVAELLFVLARTANAEHGDMEWQPGLSAAEGDASTASGI
jgi:cob(I)alamin adenosyltransferase